MQQWLFKIKDFFWVKKYQHDDIVFNISTPTKTNALKIVSDFRYSLVVYSEVTIRSLIWKTVKLIVNLICKPRFWIFVFYYFIFLLKNFWIEEFAIKGKEEWNIFVEERNFDRYDYLDVFIYPIYEIIRKIRRYFLFVRGLFIKKFKLLRIFIFLLIFLVECFYVFWLFIFSLWFFSFFKFYIIDIIKLGIFCFWIISIVFDLIFWFNVSFLFFLLLVCIEFLETLVVMKIFYFSNCLKMFYFIVDLIKICFSFFKLLLINIKIMNFINFFFYLIYCIKYIILYFIFFDIIILLNILFYYIRVFFFIYFRIFFLLIKFLFIIFYWNFFKKIKQKFFLFSGFIKNFIKFIYYKYFLFFFINYRMRFFISNIKIYMTKNVSKKKIKYNIFLLINYNKIINYAYLVSKFIYLFIFRFFKFFFINF